MLSKTLESITVLKIKELEKQKRRYEERKHGILEAAEGIDGDQRKKVFSLLSGVIDLVPSASSDPSVANITKWTHQAAHDRSMPPTKLLDFEKQLVLALDVGTRRLDLADLHSRLLMEWLNPPGQSIGHPATGEHAGSEESFEVIEKDRLQQLVNKFESVVFTPVETDEIAIDQYLAGLFEGDKGSSALDRIRGLIREQGEARLGESAPFDESSIQWCIRCLMKNDLLDDSKKATLRDILQDRAVILEVADVLNMRYKDLDSWSWDEPNGVPVLPRRQLNGKWRIMMDEDILQAIFLHFIGTSWSVLLSKTLKEVDRSSNLMTCKTELTQAELDRRKYFLESWATADEYRHSLEKQRSEMYRQDFFMSALPSSVWEGAGGYEDDEDDDGEAQVLDHPDSAKKSGLEIRQQTLRLLASEVLVQKALHGQVAVVQSDLQWFGTSLPHSTILAVLRFFGFSEDWIHFFKKFLETLLDTSPSGGTSGPARVRRRGMPMAHAIEKLLGELVMFGMEVAVKQEADVHLYRMHDDLWLVGPPEKCRKGWKAVNDFANVLGLVINLNKTGSAYITADGERNPGVAESLPDGQVSVGFLQLDADSGSWVIDQDQVKVHVRQLRTQLAACTSVLSWAQTWNSCIGRFFGHIFGEPAHCFGPAHADSILATHQRIQDRLFEGEGCDGSVTEYLKRVLRERFGAADVPDAFLFLPAEFGGLGLRNPFVPLLLVRAQLEQTPQARIKAFFAEERRRYDAAKRDFEQLSARERRQRARDVRNGGLWTVGEAADETEASDADLGDDFFPFDEYARHRERTSVALRATYETLMERPRARGVCTSERVREELRRLERADPEAGYGSLDEETRWIVQFYADELFRCCGGLSLVERRALPLGVLAMLKSRRVTWQLVL